MCSSNRHEFSRRFHLFVKQTLLSYRTDNNFPRNPYFSPRKHTNFPGASIFSSNRYSFSRKPYLVLEHLRFFRRPALCLKQIGIFQEGTPSRTDISLIGLGGCFRIFKKNHKIQDNLDLTIGSVKDLFKAIYIVRIPNHFPVEFQ